MIAQLPFVALFLLGFTALLVAGDLIIRIPPIYRALSRLLDKIGAE